MALENVEWLYIKKSEMSLLDFFIFYQIEMPHNFRASI